MRGSIIATGLVGLAFVLPVRSHASPAAVPTNPAVQGRLTSDIAAAVRRYDIPGATVEITRDGRVVYLHAFGRSDIAAGTATQDGTHYEIGSITKQFTAAAILQLHEAGEIDLDAKIAAYVPDAPHASEITVRELLAQTSGLPDYLDVPGIDTSKAVTYDQLIASIADKPLDFAPGSDWRYSNTNYLLLGKIIENVSRERYETYVQRHILDPLGMSQTFTTAQEASVPDMAFGYQLSGGQLSAVRAPISQSYGWSAGDLISTVGDMAKWNDALQNGRVVSPAEYVLMTTPQPTTQGNSGYGFGLFVDKIDEQPRVGHTGGDPGFTAANEYFPNQNVRIIALTNDGNDNGHPEAGEILTTVAFEDLFPDVAAAAVRPAPGADAAVTAAVTKFVTQMQSGRIDYATLTPHLGAEFKARYATLFASELAPYGPPEAFVFRSDRTKSGSQWYDYVIRFGPGVSLKIAVGFDAAGKISGLSFG